MKHMKWLIVGITGVLATLFALWIHLWIQLFTCFPPEQVWLTSTSPDGDKTARFSVKHEGIFHWLPSDIEPHYYVTVFDGVHGRMLLRQEDFDGDMTRSFSKLATKHAPWAVKEFNSTND